MSHLIPFRCFMLGGPKEMGLQSQHQEVCFCGWDCRGLHATVLGKIKPSKDLSYWCRLIFDDSIMFYPFWGIQIARSHVDTSKRMVTLRLLPEALCDRHQPLFPYAPRSSFLGTLHTCKSLTVHSKQRQRTKRDGLIVGKVAKEVRSEGTTSRSRELWTNGTWHIIGIPKFVSMFWLAYCFLSDQFYIHTSTITSVQVIGCKWCHSPINPKIELLAIRKSRRSRGP